MYGPYNLNITEDIENVAMESLKTMKITWDNIESATREFNDAVEIEQNLKKIIDLDKNHLKVLNNFYNEINHDDLNAVDKIFRKYLPTIVSVVGLFFSGLMMTRLNIVSEDTSNIIGGAGLVSLGAGIISKLKLSKSVNFKNNCLKSIDLMKQSIKEDIMVNQKLLSAGVKTKTQALKCSVKITDSGEIAVYRKY